ncbi:tetratricopeptide-like helical domain-containing protein [Tanacetum coccineum]
MDDNKLNSHIDVYNILIDRASKCLKFDTAKRLFHDLIVKGLKPDVKTYKVINTWLRQPGFGGILHRPSSANKSLICTSFSAT